MTEGLWEGEDGGPGWGVGIALGGLFIASPERRSCWKGAEWGQALPKKKSRAGSWEQAGEGPGAGWPAWRRFRSLGSEAVLGSWLEPLISKQRVTWMPGIPEPGLFRCALPPPPTLLPAPRPPASGDGQWDKGTGTCFPSGTLLPPGKASCSLHCSPAHGPLLCLPNLLPPHPGGGRTLPPEFYPGGWGWPRSQASALPGPSKLKC